MNQNVLIGGVVVIILLLAGGWYISTSNGGSLANTPADTTTVQPTPVSPTPKATASAITFHSIFTQPGNHKCVFSQVASTGQTNSVVYIADGKMRADFRTTGTVNSANFVIYSGGFLYSWKEGATVGKKSSVKTLADLPLVIPNDLTSGAIYGTSPDSVGWNCNDWLKDVSVFTIPTYVTFTAAS